MFGRKKQAESAAADTRQRKPMVANKRKVLGDNKQKSVSMGGPQVRGIMKYPSYKESLDAKYGESGNPENGGKGGIKFKNIEIREYERTIGDNPSCSSGPPIS